MGGHIRFERGLLLLQLCELALDGGDALAGLAEFLAAELGASVRRGSDAGVGRLLLRSRYTCRRCGLAFSIMSR